MADNFPENVEDEDVPIEAVSGPADAGNAPKKVRGRPITKDTARAMQLSSTQAKRRRKEARLKMLAALTERLDMGEELYKAMASKDSDYLDMIERATKLVGLQHDQSQEALAQKLEIKADTTVTPKRDIVINFRRATPEDAK